MTKRSRFSMFVFIISIVFIISFTMLNTGINIKNPTKDKTTTMTNEIDAYDTEYVYDDTVPSDSDPIVIEEGINGLSYTYDGLSYTKLSDKKNQIMLVGTGKKGSYTGTLTGYGPDCPGCSLVGNVSCKTREGTKHSIKNDGVYYTDSLYGNVRIVAADNSAFPCGTIVKIKNNNLEEFTAIVLDTGFTMRKAWSEGTVWMDVAFSSEAEAHKNHATNKNTTFSIQRWGW